MGEYYTDSTKGDSTLAERARHSFSHRLKASHTRLVALPSCSKVVQELRLGVRSLVVPSLGGSPIACTDLREQCKRAHDHGELVIVDNTLATSFGCQAIQLGAQIVVESLDQVMGVEAPGICAVSVSRDARGYCAGVRMALESLPEAPVDACVAVGRGLATFERRRHSAGDAAQVAAVYLRCHPAVRTVAYPGLRRDPSFEVAARTLRGGFGPIVDFAVESEVAERVGERTVLLSESWAPAGTSSLLVRVRDSHKPNLVWMRLWCGTADAKEMVVALEAALESGRGV